MSAPAPEGKEETEKPVTHGVVNQGDLESMVLLEQIKAAIGDGITIEIDYEEVPTEEEIETEEPEPTPKLKSFFEKLREKAISVLHFPATYEEAVENIKGRNGIFFNKLRQAASDLNVPIQISTPFITVTKDAIEKKAQELDLDISKLRKKKEEPKP